MMPTAFSATAWSTPTLATRRPTSSSMAPRPSPHSRRIATIISIPPQEHKRHMLQREHSHRLLFTLGPMFAKRCRDCDRQLFWSHAFRYLYLEQLPVARRPTEQSMGRLDIGSIAGLRDDQRSNP